MEDGKIEGWKKCGPGSGRGGVVVMVRGGGMVFLIGDSRTIVLRAPCGAG